MNSAPVTITSTVSGSGLRPWRTLATSSGGDSASTSASGIETRREMPRRSSSRYSTAPAAPEHSQAIRLNDNVVVERQHVHEPRHGDPVGEDERVRGERVLRHALVDEVVVLRRGLVAHERVEQHERQRRGGADGERETPRRPSAERAHGAGALVSRTGTPPSRPLPSAAAGIAIGAAARRRTTVYVSPSVRPRSRSRAASAAAASGRAGVARRPGARTVSAR